MHSVLSTVGGHETPDFLELRKGRESSVSETPVPRTLYQVVPEKTTAVRGLMGSERGYDVAGLANTSSVPVLGDERGTKRKAHGVDVSLDSADDLENLSSDQLRAIHEAASRGSAGVPGGANREDYSDMVAKEMSKKKQKMDKDKASKGKEKEYKF